MNRIPAPIASKVFMACTAFSMIPLTVIGCSGTKAVGPRTQDPTRVSIEDFINHDEIDQSDSSQPVTTHQNRPDTLTEDQVTPRSETSQTVQTNDGFTLGNRPAEPTQETGTTQPSTPFQGDIAGLTLLDAKVGDVNGKPIFTNSFFAPLEDRLLALSSSQNSIQNWRKATTQILASRLDGIIADELLRAEALAALSPTQRVGLQAFLSNFRNTLLSENLGSSQLASRRIQEEQGLTLDEALKQKEVDTLVQLTLIQEINRRVNVSWRDIQQRYERDIEKYSPPPTAMIRVIRAFKDDADTIGTIQSELDSGTPFVAIAAGKLNNYKTETDGLLEVLIEDDYETTVFFGTDELNEATQHLAVGQSIGPIESGSTVYWIKLMSIEQESVSLYDAQLQIQSELNSERKQEVYEQYIGRLNERAKISSRDEVLMRLLSIAEERYGPKS